MLSASRNRASKLFNLALWIGVAALGLSSAPASAIPSFARQTGASCSSCHTVFPALTAFGRQFKLRGYTLGSGNDDKAFPYNLPLAMGVQVANTSIKDPNKGADKEADFPRADKVIVQQVALYYGGKVAGNVGAFAQYNWDGIERSWGAEMVDIRYADSTTTKGKELLYGVSVSNSPSVQDVWNTSPMWTFPHLGNAGIMPMVTSLMDMTLANQVGGIGAYGFYDSQYYGEVGFFHNGKKGIFRPLNWGKDLTTAVEGNAPHLRLAWEKNWDANSLEIGMHALRANIYPDPANLSGPTDRFTDLAIDGQYQHDGGAHMYSVHAFYSREKRDWLASLPMGMASNASDNLDTFKLSAHYWYQRKIGGGIGIFDYRGDSDMLKYGMGGTASAMGNASGSPDTRGWIAEADWLPLKNEQNLKIGLRYTAYTKFNGASDNYNGFGRNASDNNSVFAYLWMLY